MIQAVCTQRDKELSKRVASRSMCSSIGSGQ
jgi:hypothetical protein